MNQVQVTESLVQNFGALPAWAKPFMIRGETGGRNSRDTLMVSNGGGGGWRVYPGSWLVEVAPGDIQIRDKPVPA